jgi:hypothetical protein
MGLGSGKYYIVDKKLIIPHSIQNRTKSERGILWETLSMYIYVGVHLGLRANRTPIFRHIECISHFSLFKSRLIPEIYPWTYSYV